MKKVLVLLAIFVLGIALVTDVFCATTYSWYTKDAGVCVCNGIRVGETVECRDSNGMIVSDLLCMDAPISIDQLLEKLSTSCTAFSPCKLSSDYSWSIKDVGTCGCDGLILSEPTFECKDRNGKIVDNSNCKNIPITIIL